MGIGQSRSPDIGLQAGRHWGHTSESDDRLSREVGPYMALRRLVVKVGMRLIGSVF